MKQGDHTDLGNQDDTEVRNGKMDDEEDGEDDEDDNDYEDEEEGDDQDDTEVRDGEMDEEEDHPVLVLLKQPLPQQVEQGVAIGRQSHRLQFFLF